MVPKKRSVTTVAWAAIAALMLISAMFAAFE